MQISVKLLENRLYMMSYLSDSCSLKKCLSWWLRKWDLDRDRILHPIQWSLSYLSNNVSAGGWGNGIWTGIEFFIPYNGHCPTCPTISSVSTVHENATLSWSASSGAKCCPSQSDKSASAVSSWFGRRLIGAGNGLIDNKSSVISSWERHWPK